MNRGIRLNNPFDIEKSDTHWLGKCYPGSDPVFEQFDTMAHGLRAGFKNILTAFNVHGRKTINAIIPIYAPPSENDTAAYMAAMCLYMGCGESDVLNLNDINELVSFGKGVLVQEQGASIVNYIGIETIQVAAQYALHNVVANTTH